MSYDVNVYGHFELDDSDYEFSADAQGAEPIVDHPAGQWTACAPPAGWSPQFLVLNASKEMTLLAEQYWRLGNRYLVFWNALAEVEDTFELQRFPFDRQVMTCPIAVTNGAVRPFDRGLIAQKLPPFFDNVLDDDFFVLAQSILEHWKVAWIQPTIEGDLVEIKIGLERQSMFFVTNICGFVFVIVLSAFASIIIPRNIAIADRLSLVITLMLAVVAFKFVIVTMTPPTSYLTLLDGYLLLSMFLLFSVLVKDFLITRLDASQLVDESVTLAMAISWVLFHVVLRIGAARKWFVWPWTVVQDKQSEGEACNIEAGSAFIAVGDKQRRQHLERMLGISH